MKIIILTICSLVLGACTTFKPVKNNRLLRNGVNAELEASKIKLFHKNQSEVLEALELLAGEDLQNAVSCDDINKSGADDKKDVAKKKVQSVGNAKWQEITRAGFMVVDRECQHYLTLLYQLDKAKKEVGSQMNLITSTTAAVQGLLEESAKTLSITAAGLGFLQGAWRNYRSSLLFELEPEIVKGLVGKLQDVYQDEFEFCEIKTRTNAFTSIYNYAELCSPIKISLEISNSIKAANAKPTVDPATSKNETLKITVDPNQFWDK